MSDKVRQLAEKLTGELTLDEQERILRAELESLLEAAQQVVDDYANRSQWQGSHPQTSRLAAELQHWTGRTPDGR